MVSVNNLSENKRNGTETGRSAHFSSIFTKRKINWPSLLLLLLSSSYMHTDTCLDMLHENKKKHYKRSGKENDRGVDLWSVLYSIII
jgi:hypothetical protein